MRKTQSGITESGRIGNENAPGQGGEVGKTNCIQQDQFSYPSPSSVKGRVLGAQLRGERLTHWDCWQRFGSARLSHHIYVLRREGWPVEMIERSVSTSDAGRPATIGVYFLADETIHQAGEQGQDYAAECAKVEAERRAA